MAMRPTNPPRLVNRYYEQFSPLSEWKKEGEADLLLVFLPGFVKENIRVTTETKNIIKISGESSVADSKWNRFQEDFQIPEHCNIRGIRAKFEGGILTITMPWKAEVKTTPVPAPPMPPPPPPPPPPAPAPRPQQSNAIPSQAASSTSNTKKAESTSSQAMSTPKPANSPNFTSTIGANKSTNSTSLEPPRPQNVKEHDKTSNTTSSESNEIKRPKMYPNTMEKSIGKEDTKKKDKEPNQDEKVIKKIVDERDEEKSGFGGYSLNEYKQVLKGLARVPNEERELMVNMGVAVLVIVALGAYISYTYLGN